MKRSNLFWISFSDLLTSLFFVMLVLYIISFVLYQKSKDELNSKISQLEDLIKVHEAVQDSLHKQDSTIRVLAEKYQIIQSVENNLEPLKKEEGLFIYEPEYKRYRLSFEVQFDTNKFLIQEGDLINYQNTVQRLDTVGQQLKEIVDILELQKKENEKFKNISYLIVVSGSASDLPKDNTDNNYTLSYLRAYHLYKYWKEKEIDFDNPKYHDLIEFQIAGNGIGGIGRFHRDPESGFISEKKNQRFLINIIPKIGEL